MTGIPYYNFPAFMAAAHMLRNRGWDVFNPAEADIARAGGVDISLDNPTGDPSQISKYGFTLGDCLDEDTTYICKEAKAIAFLPGWEFSSGARAEWALAVAMKHEFIYLQPKDYI